MIFSVISLVLDISSTVFSAFSAVQLLKLVLHTDCLRLREKPNGLQAPLPANTRLLHPAEWHPQISQQPAIHPDCSRLQALRQSMPALQITRPNIGGQTVIHAIRQLNQLLVTVEGSHRHDWTKYLLLHGIAF